MNAIADNLDVISKKNSRWMISVLTIQLILIAFVVALLASHYTHSLEHKKDFRLLEMDDQIEYLDEVLTMSINMFAATGKEKWIQRYLRHAENLDAVIAEVEQNVTKNHAHSIATIKQSNDALISMEEEAINLIQSGASDEALKVLSNNVYVQQKQVYKSEVTELRDDIYAEMFDRIERDEKQMMYIIFIAMLLMSMISVVSVRIASSRWRKYHETHTKILREKEQNVRLSEERFTLALCTAEIGLWELNIEAGEIFTDNICDEMLGYSVKKSDSTTRPWKINDFRNRFHPDDNDEAVKKYEDHIAGNTNIYTHEHRARTADGGWKWVLDVGRVIERDEKGKALKILGISENIDEIKRTQLQLEQAKNASEAANRAKSQFLASMSHELRTPLNAIIGFTHIMLQNRSIDKENNEYLNIIHKSGEHLLALINDVIDFAKIEANKTTLKHSNINLQKFLDDIFSMLGMRAKEKAILLNSVYADKLPKFVYIDPLKLRQVLINLIGNSIKFTRKGSVTLKVDVEMQDSKIQGMLHFEVHDTGRGISSKDQKKLFKPFMQADNHEDSVGTGLGLSISQHFVKMMGGKIQIVSTLGKGSIFKFSIPISATDAKSTISEKSLGREIERIATGQTVPTVLVVEDVEYSRLLLARQLNRVGFIVHTAKNGQEGLEIFEEIQPELVIMDINMPVMNGKSTAQRMRQTKSGDKTKIIAMTASVTNEEVDGIIKYGFDDIIFKPIKINALFLSIEDLTGINFIYHNEQQSQYAKPIDLSGENDIAYDPLTADQTATLDDDWIIEFKQNAIEGDLDKLYALLGDLTDEDNLIKQKLTKIIDGYRFDAIEEIFGIDT